MATKTSRRLWVLVLSLLHAGVSWGFLDIDELSSVNYGIDILSDPVVLGKELAPGQVLLRTKYGQQYQCGYPDNSEDEKKFKKEEKVAEETGVPDLLRPMENAPCLVFTKDWWTYEFCYGRVIKQYHVEDGKIKGAVSILGNFQSEFDWNTADLKDSKSRRKKELIRYHSQQYVNGTLCALTGNSRRVEVRFQCESGVGDYISRVDEPETCVYIMTVHTMKICHHPYLKPPHPNKPVPISCNPVLTQQEYEEYLEDQKVEEQAKEEAKRLQHLQKVKSIKEYREKMEKEGKMVDGIMVDQSEDSSDSDTPLDSTDTQTDETTDETDESSLSLDTNSDFQTENELDTSVTKLEKLMVNSLSKGIQDLANDNQDDENPNVKVNFKVIKDPKEIQKYMNHFLSSEEKADKSDDTDDDSTVSDTEDTEQHTDTQTDTDTRTGTDTGISTDTEATTENVDPEVNTVKKVSTDSHSDPSKSLSEQEFDKMDAATDKEAVDEFDEGLEKISKNEISNAQKFKDNLHSVMQSKFSDIVQEAQDDLQKEGIDEEINKPEAYKTLAKTLNKLLKKLDDTGKDLKKMDEKLKDKINRAKSKLLGDSSISQEDSAETTDDSTDIDPNAETKEPKAVASNEPQIGKVRVRVTRVKHRDKADSEDDGPTGQSSLRISQDQKEKLESSVRSELKKAGMDTQGRKIEVKIITNGFYDKDDDTLHTLSEHDTTAFNKMVLTILGRSQETAKAIEKQQRMESNYNLVWKPRKKKQTQTELPPEGADDKL